MKITKKLIDSYDGRYSGDKSCNPNYVFRFNVLCDDGKMAIKRFLKKFPKGQVLNKKNLQDFVKNVNLQNHGIILHGILEITGNERLANEFADVFLWCETAKKEQMEKFMKLTKNMEIF